ncbi:trans-aconitate 2-methyltransferase [Streptomyces mashuensis]|uniref:Trans-aconitate 2-methyltransferase n=1 Tax=Streptomyces mashuensis TaxID=33904 RepID=A0A919B7T8_9ACTN|nr:trans-aconitate 2-methyltransferase [Streptomyces mashuensis]GHF64215.1 trans-aconitate 2-methyltransferase [Streptomyces mashuensis]
MSQPAWDPAQYLRHADHRTRPFHDLLARVPDPARPAPRIADLGCGAGNATALLARRWPDAHVTGLDNSPAMLERAAAHAGPRLAFRHADLTTWTPHPGTYDLLISNAALQWVPGHADAFPAWLAGLTPGGTLALQVPGNDPAPSHTLLRNLCTTPRWRTRLAEVGNRTLDGLTPQEYLERLTQLGCEVDAWETTYLHVLQGDDPVLDWMRGTGLRPALTALADDEEATTAFLDEYGALLREAYPRRPYGTVFPFRRVFVVARTQG